MLLSTRTISSLPREAISLICWSLLEDGGYRRSPQRQLLVVARTCHILSEPALDVIWHTIPSIWPLLLLLPEDLGETRPISPEWDELFDCEWPRIEFAFRREPRPDDFGRWVKYASRVRTIDFYAGKASGYRRVLAFDVPDMLQAHCPKPVLPNLRYLRHLESKFSKGDREAFPTSFLLSPTLKSMSLALAMHSHVDHLQDIVKNLSRLSPWVEKLEFWRASDASGSLGKGFQASLRGLETCRLLSLTSFVAGDGVHVMSSALLGLGRLPHLKSLQIRPLADSSDWNPSGRREGFFAALTDINLDGKDSNLACCIALLGAISPTSLHSFFIDLRWPDASQAEVLFTALSEALGGLPCPGSVNTITIAMGDIHHNYQDHGIYHAPCITPLLSLRGLQSLVIRGGCKIIVDDALLDAMSHSWPAIRTVKFEWPERHVSGMLSLYERYEEGCEYTNPALNAPDRPQATLGGLVPLALRCAHLTELAVAVNMRVVPNYDGQRCPPVFRTPEQESKLKTLATIGSVIGDSWAVASFLSLVFPRLRLLGDNVPYDYWERSEMLYGKLLEMRRKERRWATETGKGLKGPDRS